MITFLHLIVFNENFPSWNVALIKQNIWPIEWDDILNTPLRVVNDHLV